MNDNTKTIAGIVIIILLLFTSVFAFIANSKNKRNLNSEKLQSESLLSEKLLIQKDLDRIKSELAALQSKNDATERSLAETELKLAEKEKRIASFSRDNNSLIRSRKELSELQKEKADLDLSYANLKLEHEKSLAQNADLQNAVASLETQKKELSDKMKQRELFDSDNFEVYGSRGKKKEKLTFWACRTKKLNINFDVPQSLTEVISFKIVTPSGTTITPDDKALSWSFPSNSQNFTASLSPVTGEFEQSRQVVLTYSSKTKLDKGEYKIQILCNNINIGNCRVKLK